MSVTRCMTVFIIAACCTFTASSTNRPDIVLGGLFPVHKNQDGSCGEILDLGIQRLEAMVLAVRLVNEDPDLLPGLRLGFDIRDTCTQPNIALQSSLDFVVGLDASGAADDSTPSSVTYTDVKAEGSSNASLAAVGISGVVGSASSSESISAASLLRLFDTPQISYASTARILSDKTRYEYFLRTLPPDLYQAKVMVELVQQYNWTYVIAINSDDVYGREGIAAFIQELQTITTTDDNSTVTNSRSFCTTGTPISVSVTATDDQFDDIIDQINEAWIGNSSVVMLFGQLATAEGMLRALMRHPNHRPLTFVVSDAVGNNLHPMFYSTYHGLITVLPEYRESEDFNEYFTNLKPTRNSNPWFMEYWESVFGCAFNSSSSSQQSNDISMCDDTKQSLISSSYEQNSKVPFVMDAVLAFAHAIHNLLTDVCGGIVLCSAVMVERFDKYIINGEMLLKHLHGVNFKGFSSDEIDFDDNGDQAGGYWINNLQYSSRGFEFIRIAEWSNTSLVKTGYPVSWEMNKSDAAIPPKSFCSFPCSAGQYPVVIEDQASCCWECESCRGNREVSDGTVCIVCEEGYSPNAYKSSCQENPLRYLDWTNPVSWVAFLLSLTGLTGTLFTAVVFTVYYKHKTIKASSRELSAISLTGLFLCFLIPFFSIGKPIPTTCGISRFLFGFAFSLCYSALLVKTNRIHRIFNRGSNLNQRPTLIAPHVQVFFTIFVIMVQVAISLAWLVGEIPGVTFRYNEEYTELVCSATPYLGIILSLGYNLCLLLITTYYAFRTRKIPQNFNEAKFININVYLVIFIWITFIPLYIGLYGANTISYTYLSSMELIAIDLSALSSLSLLYFPKLYSMYMEKRKDPSEKSNGHDCNSSTIDKKPLRIGSLNGYNGNTITGVGRPAYLERSKSLPKTFHMSMTTQTSVAALPQLDTKPTEAEQLKSPTVTKSTNGHAGGVDHVTSLADCPANCPLSHSNESLASIKDIPADMDNEVSSNHVYV